VHLWSAFSVVTLVLVGGCANSPVVRNLPGFRESALSGGRVAFVRLAVSDDLGDARTGIVMSATTRTRATLSACASVSRTWSAGRVICLVPSNGEPAAELLELERFYAKDRPVRRSLLRTIRAKTNSDFMLLFRPENVETEQNISQTRALKLFPNSTGPVHTTAGVDLPRAQSIHTMNETELSYTVSAVLFDLRTMKPLRGALHSRSASRTVKHNVGFAEAPSAVPLLAEIMSELGKAVLDD
jgi:hypothetical protein